MTRRPSAAAAGRAAARARLPGHPARRRARPAGRAAGDAHRRPEAAVAGAVRQGAAALQPALPPEPAGLPHPGAGLWRAEAGDAGAAGGARRAAGRRQRRPPPHPRRQPPAARHAAGARVRRACSTWSPCCADDFEFEGRPYRSLSAIARHITGTRWNGWTFFGLKSSEGRHEPPQAARPAGACRPRCKKLRCAVYTRKSTDEGLEKEFNTLDAQRDACEAYVACQRAEGWVLVRDRYDDGGFSGGTLERPGAAAPAGRHRARAGRRHRGLQDRPPVPAR